LFFFLLLFHYCATIYGEIKVFINQVCQGVSRCVKDGSLFFVKPGVKVNRQFLMGYLTISTNVRCYQTHHRLHFFFFQQDNTQVHCVYNTIQLSENVIFAFRCFAM